MPKLKTNKSARKRFKLSKRGKLQAHKGGKRHLLTSKSKNRKRHLRKGITITGKVARITKKLLPYG
ncbi:MAG: 50S ribosomal protein L35 [Candidatus Omnitrophota bacterium]